jgi:hypothetical protein
MNAIEVFIHLHMCANTDFVQYTSNNFIVDSNHYIRIFHLGFMIELCIKSSCQRGIWLFFTLEIILSD